ncbi:hypothetical protein GC102_25455 [Paenibacillus sp. LMG 31460]|uniref:Uncharacterized protein n=1 Tax=Paenibacillus germinis TaxID=2654979 RepID=A0ABX1Z886_9BACL|nr:hypothetical protein [Paenibacillus germinis]
MNPCSNKYTAHRNNNGDNHNGSHQLFGCINEAVENTRNGAAQRFRCQQAKRENTNHTNHHCVSTLY